MSRFPKVFFFSRGVPRLAALPRPYAAVSRPYAVPRGRGAYGASPAGWGAALRGAAGY